MTATVPFDGQVIAMMSTTQRFNGGRVDIHLGVVSDFDFEEGLGLIDADDGRILPFSGASCPRGTLRNLKIGARVGFEEAVGELGARATHVWLQEMGGSSKS